MYCLKKVIIKDMYHFKECRILSNKKNTNNVKTTRKIRIGVESESL
jgi:hypothetical protein